MVQLLFICRKTNYFSKNYFTNFAKYNMGNSQGLTRLAKKLSKVKGVSFDF